MGLKKRSFADIKSKYSKKAKFKPDRFFDLGEAFLDATGIPGPAMGHLQMFLGHSDTGKTTALVKTAVAAQQKKILPVLIIVGYQARIAAGILSIFCLTTAFLFHFDFSDQSQFISFLKNIGLAGGFLFIVANGTKDWAVDREKKYVRL